MHGDDEAFGSVHRVELFDKFPKRVRLPDVVSVMNRAATEDVRSPAWPVVSRVLHGGPAPNARAAQVVSLLDDWVRRDAPRLDADDNGFYDDPGPAIMDARVGARSPKRCCGRCSARSSPMSTASAIVSDASYLDKDLRTLLGRRVEGKFNLRYCGAGSLGACRDVALDGDRPGGGRPGHRVRARPDQVAEGGVADGLRARAAARTRCAPRTGRRSSRSWSSRAADAGTDFGMLWACRCSSSRSTPRAACTTTSGWRSTACWCPGRCPRGRPPTRA